MKIAFIASFPPRECGIATFTHNLMQSVRLNLGLEKDHINTEDQIAIIALNDPNMTYQYPSEVGYVIRQNKRADYDQAGKFIHDFGADICVLQHEFGIFGGESGVYVLSLLHKLQIPFIVTFHTILKTPSYLQKSILQEIASRAAGVVVMSRKAVAFLENIYAIPVDKIHLIEHGVPDIPTDNIPSHRNLLAPYRDRKILFTFGLMNRNKGVETVIKALPSVIAKHPEVVYLILGNTHPGVVRNSGEEYRDYLTDLIKQLGIENHVHFINQFVTEKELAHYLSRIDIYITPYLNKAQITSGTLSYAVGAGAAVLSTPYWHAKELLSEGRGLLFDFKNHVQLAEKINLLLDNPEQADELRKNAAFYGQKTRWSQMGKRYVNLFNTVLKENMLSPTNYREISINLPALPTFDMSHIFRLTDNTGIIQHAKYGIPNLKEGYCLDDNARALMMAVLAYRRYKSSQILELLPVYLSFINYMQRQDGLFRNFLNFRKESLEDIGSEDAFGRSIWGLGILIRYAPNSAYREAALETFFRAAPHFSTLSHLRGIGNTIIGICHYLAHFPTDENLINCVGALSQKLIDAYHRHADAEWHWFENKMIYDNGILPLALFHAYRITGNETLKKTGLESLDFLEKICFRNDWFTPVGNEGWYEKGQHPALFDQQAIETMAMVLLYNEAHLITGKSSWLHKMYRCHAWFLGENELHIPLYDQETGGCCDGLQEGSINRNQGAESTLAYWISHLVVMQSMEAETGYLPPSTYVPHKEIAL